MDFASGHSSWGRVVTQPCLIYYLNSLASGLQLSSHTCPVQGLWELCLPSLTPSYHTQQPGRIQGLEFSSGENGWKLCHARNYTAEQISGCSGVLWPLLVSNTCWAIFKSRDDGEVALQGGKTCGWCLQMLRRSQSTSGATQQQVMPSGEIQLKFTSKEKCLNSPGLTTKVPKKTQTQQKIPQTNKQQATKNRDSILVNFFL